jgi:hypothetical protein
VGDEVLNMESTPSGANAKSDGPGTEPSSGEAMVNMSTEPPNQEAREASSSDPSGNDESAKMEDASVQGLLNIEPALGGENVKLGEADKVQLPPSPVEEAVVDVCSEPPNHEAKEAVSSDPSGNNENVEVKNTAAAQGLLSTEPIPCGENARHGEADTEQQLPPSCVESMVDISSELPSQEVKEAPSTEPSGNDEDVKMEEAPAARGSLNTDAGYGGENAKLGEAGMELQLPPSSGEAMVEISSEPLSQEAKEAASTSPPVNDVDELQLPHSSGEAMVEMSSKPLSQEAKEAASTGPPGNNENAKVQEATVAAQVLLNTKPAHDGETSRLAGGDTELQLTPSGQAMVDISSEPPSILEVNEASSTGALGNDENTKTENTAAAEPAPGSENTELGEANTERQAKPESAVVMVESSSELPSQEGKEAAATDLSGDDEKAKSARAAVVAELFGDATEGGSDQPLPSPRGEGEDADAGGGVE